MLQEEIDSTQRLVRTDAYQMSVGEVVSMYRDGELVINPDFQRLFSWEIGQKSRLIESLLLGIPLPSIFVFETEDSKWELIDGLQRVSTILEFMGLLKRPDAPEVAAPSVLVATKYLPSLNNVVWEKSSLINDVDEADQSSLDRNHQLAIRRARMSVEILKRPSSNNTKYDLFQRLNAGGTQANAQELRNCIVIMVNRSYFQCLRLLSEDENFREVLAATEDQVERQRPLEYTTRFLVYTHIPYDGKLDVEEYIDEGIIKLAEANETAAAVEHFKATFRLLSAAFGGNALRRYSNAKHSGRVGLAAFECIAIGIGSNLSEIEHLADPITFVRDRTTTFWLQPDLEQNLSKGQRGTSRIQRTLAAGTSWFKP